jgi:RNA polymerase sigma-70 factor, ECF subfamily
VNTLAGTLVSSQGQARHPVCCSAALRDADLAEPADEGARRVLDRYMAAFESSDPAAIKRLLADDAVLEMTGTSTWFPGKATCERFITRRPLAGPGTG